MELETAETTHRGITGDARAMREIGPDSVDLVVTSPPYPMIEMWDECFGHMSAEARQALQAGHGWAAFEAMHRSLDEVWSRCAEVVKPGGFVCINIGDATRTVAGEFALYPNHARIGQAMQKAGFTPLPVILWRKQTNAPNKFMGSGMLPSGAYVTLEHEYILVFRKGGKRIFKPNEKETRNRSAFFWEERNQWFSDLWEFKGTRQAFSNKDIERRSAAFPFELPYRLICMYSMEGDTVLDPFHGSGTTMLAAMAAGRHSIGYDFDPDMAGVIDARVAMASETLRAKPKQRLIDHLGFLAARTEQGKPVKHENGIYGFPVMTKQEAALQLLEPTEIIEPEEGVFIVRHKRVEHRRLQARLDEASTATTPMPVPKQTLEAWAE